MLPLTDDAPCRTFPFVTWLLIAANTALFGCHVFGWGLASRTVYLELGFIPYEWFHGVDIAPANRLPVPLTVFSAMFLHGGWLHLLSNMLYLGIFGDNVEDRLGHARFLGFYLLCGVVAALVHGGVHWESRVPLVGASGAIAGILGAYLYFFPQARIRTLLVVFVFVKVLRIPALVVLIYWVCLQVVSGLAELDGGGTGVAWFAHLGGFACGLGVAVALRTRRPRKTARRRHASVS